MVIIYFIAAVFCMVIGHILKVRRWALLISTHEVPNQSELLRAMATGHTINALLPIRIGEIFRVILSGKHMKNGYSFSVATVIVDLYVDLITVSCMFFGLAVIGKGGESLQIMAHWYILFLLVAIVAMVLCVVLRKQTKRIVQLLAGIFNEKLEFQILYVFYMMIASLKDIIQRIDRKKFIADTLGMWICYVASYVLYAETVQRMGYFHTTSAVFTLLFTKSSLYQISAQEVPVWSIYLILPLIICLGYSYLIHQKENSDTLKPILPHMNQNDRLAFLRTYYADDNREHLKTYLEINQDAQVVQDNSAGSNASTVVILKDGKMFFRKYAFDADGEKLAEQIEWIQRHQEDIPLPSVTNVRDENGFCAYDMHSYGSATGLFHYIHSSRPDECWGILEQALKDIQSGLYQKNSRPCDKETIQKYIKTKVEKNISIIENGGRYLKNLMQYETLIVNGQVLNNISYYSSMFMEEHMAAVFSEDTYCDIHGDLTIENIICLANSDELDSEEYDDKILPKSYYFIDPNTGNIHDSPFLDYGKLLQSLHGNYEFLMMVKSVKIEGNSIAYIMTKSEAYSEIYKKYCEYLKKNFSKSQVLSIYYHEIIHWLRLMPYKIRKNEKLAVVFFTGLLMVLKDVWRIENAE